MQPDGRQARRARRRAAPGRRRGDRAVAARRGRREPVEAVPARGGRSRRPGCRRRRSPAAERRVSSVSRSGERAPRRRRRAGPRRARGQGVAPGQRVEAGDPVDQPVRGLDVEDRLVGRPLPRRRARSMTSRHQDRGPAVVGRGGPEVRASRRPVAGPTVWPRASPPATPRGCRRRGSPGRSSRASASVRLRTNRRVVRAPAALNVEPDQPSVGNGALGHARQAVFREQVGERAARASRSRAGMGRQHGAGTSSAPSGPPSMYSTCESGQLRVRTTTSGSVVEAFSSTWISPAGM